MKEQSFRVCYQIWLPNGPNYIFKVKFIFETFSMVETELLTYKIKKRAKIGHNLSNLKHQHRGIR